MWKKKHSIVYSLKPTHNSDFEFSRELNELKEPKNIIEEINVMLNRIKNNVQGLKNRNEGNAIKNESIGV